MSCICLVTNRPISYNPRLVKEADALHEAGYAMRVVAVTSSTEKKALDDRLMQLRAWRLDFIDVRRQPGLCGLRWLWAGLRQKAYLSSAWLRGTRHGNARAYSRYVDELAALAAAEPADLYVAHNLQALPAAHRAARKHEALLGFDAEDFHRGELAGDDPSPRRMLTERIEERYLPACDYLTAASAGIADAYAEALHVRRPTPILNVFPLAERQGHTPPAELEQEAPPEDVVSLYWYSQTIGPDRGLQEALRALLLLPERVHLCLRGAWAAGFEDMFIGEARALGVASRVRILPPAPPDQLVERSACHHAGLALEQGKDPNNWIAASNKLFNYLLAGVPVVATATEGQRRICDDLPDATRLCGVGSPEALAEAVQSLLESDKTYEAARRAAAQAGEERYNWDTEKRKLLRTVAACLNAQERSAQRPADVRS